jgi:hypothetical protein
MIKMKRKKNIVMAIDLKNNKNNSQHVHNSNETDHSQELFPGKD